MTIHHIFSPSFLPIIFSTPGSPVSVHFCLFLPTSGQEAQFIDQLSQLSLVIEEIQAIHPGYLLFMRGDCNVNPKNTSGQKLQSLITSVETTSLPMSRLTTKLTTILWLMVCLIAMLTSSFTPVQPTNLSFRLSASLKTI